MLWADRDVFAVDASNLLNGEISCGLASDFRTNRGRIIVGDKEKDEVAVLRVKTDVNVLASVLTPNGVVAMMSADADLTILADTSLPGGRSKESIDPIQVKMSQFQCLMPRSRTSRQFRIGVHRRASLAVSCH